MRKTLSKIHFTASSLTVYLFFLAASSAFGFHIHHSEQHAETGIYLTDCGTHTGAADAKHGASEDESVLDHIAERGIVQDKAGFYPALLNMLPTASVLLFSLASVEPQVSAFHFVSSKDSLPVAQSVSLYISTRAPPLA